MRRKVIIATLIVIVVGFAYNLVIQITNALKSSDRLSDQAEVVFQMEAKNRELKKKLSQIQSKEFIEQQARNKLGLGKPGETLVIIPEEKLQQVLGASQAAQPKRVANWLGWFRVFFAN